MSSIREIASLPDPPLYAALLTALNACGVIEAERSDLFKALAAVLHLGNLAFSGEPHGTPPITPLEP